jgi:hypothetical protein
VPKICFWQQTTINWRERARPNVAGGCTPAYMMRREFFTGPTVMKTTVNPDFDDRIQCPDWRCPPLAIEPLFSPIAWAYRIR